MQEILLTLLFWQLTFNVIYGQLSCPKGRLALAGLGNTTAGVTHPQTSINTPQNIKDQKFDEEEKMKISMALTNKLRDKNSKE